MQASLHCIFQLRTISAPFSIAISAVHYFGSISGFRIFELILSGTTGSTTSEARGSVCIENIDERSEETRAKRGGSFTLSTTTRTYIEYKRGDPSEALVLLH